MEQLIQAMVRALTQAGVHAVAALPNQVMPRFQSAAVAVSISDADCRSAAVYHYLGLLDGEELYGRQLTARLRLDVYAPVALGGQGARAEATRVADILLAGIPGVNVGEIHVDACAYDAQCDCFTCSVTAQTSAFVYARVSEDSSEFLDFVLKGEVR